MASKLHPKLKVKVREGFYSNWEGGVVMWYWPKEKLLLYILRERTSGPMMLTNYSAGAWRLLKASHAKKHGGKMFERTQTGIDLVESWLKDDWKEDDAEDAQ